MKDLAKQALYQVLRNPVGEALLYEGNRRAPRSVQEPLFRRLAPQPSNYARGQLRKVTRDGFELELDPADYFQWHHYFGFHDEVLETLRRLAVGKRRILDIGANIGLYALSMARAEPAAEVVAVEPNPNTFARLSRHRELNRQTNLRCIPAAIGEQPGELVLRDAGAGDSGKFTLRPGVTTEGTRVRVLPLRDLLREVGWDGVDLIKIDVEGFEPEVFAGALDVLRAHKPVLVFELTPGWYGERTASLIKSMQALLEVNYRAERIATGNLEPMALDPVEILRNPQAPQYNVHMRVI